MDHQATEGTLARATATSKRDWRAASVAGLVLVTQWLFLLTIAILPLDAYLTLPNQQTGVFLSQVLSIEAGVALIATLLAGKVLRRATGLRLAWHDLLPLGLVLAAAALSVVFATSRSLAIKDCLKVLVYFSIYVLARAYRNLPDIRRRALLILLASFFIVLVSGLLGYTTGTPDIPDILLNIHHTSAAIPFSTVMRAESTFRYPNELAAYLLIIIPFLLACIIRFPYRLERSAGVIVLVWGIYLLVISYTRGALVALAVTTPILLYLLVGKRLAAVGLVAMLGGVAVLALKGGVSSGRILSILSLGNSGYSERMAAWRWAWNAFIHHPVFGVGIGNLALQPNAPLTNPILGIHEVDAENLVLNVLAEMGIVGLMAVLYCLGGALRVAWGARQAGGSWFDRTWNTGLFVALCGLLIFGLSDPVLISGQVTGLLCAVVGLAGIAPGRESAPAALRPATMAKRLSQVDAQIAAIQERAALQSRVVLPINAAPGSDAARYALGLATELWRRGVGVLVAVPLNSPLLPRLAAQGIPCLGIDLGMDPDLARGVLGTLSALNPVGQRAAARRILALTHGKPTIFLCPSPREQLLVTPWRGRQDIRVLWVLHSTPTSWPLGRLVRRRWLALAHEADAIIAVSPSVAEEARKLGIPAERIEVFPHSIPESQIDDESAVERTPDLIVVIARLVKTSGIQYLIEALPQVLERHPNARLAIVGTGRYEQALYRKVYALKLEHHVDFLGAVPDPTRVLHEASLFVYPSVDPGETLPAAILDAFAAGTPVVASAIASIPDIIVDQQTGTLLWPRDAGSIAHAINALLDDPARAREMGSAGREIVRAHLTSERTGTRLLQLLSEVETSQPIAEINSTTSDATSGPSDEEAGDV